MIEEPEVIARYRFGEPKDGMLDAAERYLEASEYAPQSMWRADISSSTRATRK